RRPRSARVDAATHGRGANHPARRERGIPRRSPLDAEMSIQSLLVGLTGAGVEFIVVGGVAGGIHGSPFVTNDLDVCYAVDRPNIARLIKVLRTWSPYPRGWEDGLPFSLDARALRTTPVLTLRTSQGDLDLL